MEEWGTIITTITNLKAPVRQEGTLLAVLSQKGLEFRVSK